MWKPQPLATLRASTACTAIRKLLTSGTIIVIHLVLHTFSPIGLFRKLKITFPLFKRFSKHFLSPSWYFKYGDLFFKNVFSVPCTSIHKGVTCFPFHEKQFSWYCPVISHCDEIVSSSKHIFLRSSLFWDMAQCRSCIASIFRVEKFASEELVWAGGCRLHTFLWNFGSHKIYTAPHPRRRHPS
jgi:hypothetical protein